jgi:uncharacterized Zn finger protein (UPF0148 family)
MSAHHKLSIQHHLASLLNLSPNDDEDYIGDILDQLLHIENPDDVAEYLSNFIVEGGSGDVNLFLNELGRFKSGEGVNVTAISSLENEVSKQQDKIELANTLNYTKPAASRILDEGAAQREEIRLRELEAREKQREEQERSRLKKGQEEERRRKESEMRNKKSQLTPKWENMKPPGFDKPAGVGNVKQAQATQQKATTQQSITKENMQLSKTTNKSPSATEPSKPLKGTPKIICGCFGNLHPPLTNCLHCGRISCEREGYSYCPFCNHLISQFKSNSNDSATAHKERLLEYDRTSASRTQVHDDQEDYFVTERSMWSSAEEMEEARCLEEERRKMLHQRKNQVLDIKF